MLTQCLFQRLTVPPHRPAVDCSELPRLKQTVAANLLSFADRHVHAIILMLKQPLQFILTRTLVSSNRFSELLGTASGKFQESGVRSFATALDRRLQLYRDERGTQFKSHRTSLRKPRLLGENPMHKLKIAERQRLGIPEDRGLVFEQDNVSLPLKPKSETPKFPL